MASSITRSLLGKSFLPGHERQADVSSIQHLCQPGASDPVCGRSTGDREVLTGVFEHDFTISPRTVNSFRYAINRLAAPAAEITDGIPQYEAGPGGIGILNTPSGEATTSFPDVTFSGFADAQSQGTATRAIRRTRLRTTWSTSYFSHAEYSFTTSGFVFQWLNDNQSSHYTATAPLSLAFSNANTAGFKPAGTAFAAGTGNPYASFMVGAVDSSSVNIQPFSTLGGRYRTFLPYVEDNWRVTPRLTLNLGLRWDLYTPFVETQDRFSFLNRSLPNPAPELPARSSSPATAPIAASAELPCRPTTATLVHVWDLRSVWIPSRIPCRVQHRVLARRRYRRSGRSEQWLRTTGLPQAPVMSAQARGPRTPRFI